jgi:hypothetical protein
MDSELITYALLASVFVVTGLRFFLDKPNKLREVPLRRWKGALPAKKAGGNRGLRRLP